MGFQLALLLYDVTPILHNCHDFMPLLSQFYRGLAPELFASTPRVPGHTTDKRKTHSYFMNRGERFSKIRGAAPIAILEQRSWIAVGETSLLEQLSYSI